MATFRAFTGPAEPFAVFEGKIAGQALAGIYLELVTIGGDTAGYMLKVGKDLLFPDGQDSGDIFGIKCSFLEKICQVLPYGTQSFRLLEFYRLKNG
jgi:hypothetical protein